jgi:hypothetical protein
VDGRKGMDRKPMGNKFQEVKDCFGSRRKQIFYTTSDIFMKDSF